MSNLTRFNCYREILRHELEARRARNAAYSQRAFARDLNWRPNRLSEVLAGIQGISPKLAEQTAEHLGYAETDRNYFRDLVAAAHSRSPSERSAARQRAARMKEAASYHPIEQDAFRSIAEWHHLAILELLKLADAERTTTWIARRLGVTQDDAIDAVQRLKRLGLLRETRGKWALPRSKNTVRADVPSRAVRSFHTQLLKKAMRALEEQSLNEREFSSTLLAVKRASLPRLKERVRKFWIEIDGEFGVTDADEVYCLAAQLFRVTETA